MRVRPSDIARDRASRSSGHRETTLVKNVPVVALPLSTASKRPDHTAWKGPRGKSRRLNYYDARLYTAGSRALRRCKHGSE